MHLLQKNASIKPAQHDQQATSEKQTTTPQPKQQTTQPPNKTEPKPQKKEEVVNTKTKTTTNRERKSLQHILKNQRLKFIIQKTRLQMANS
jgi:hypothetical protein